MLRYRAARLLQVMNRRGEYQAAVPVRDAVLVNIGDMMQRWTADRLVSTVSAGVQTKHVRV